MVLPPLHQTCHQERPHPKIVRTSANVFDEFLSVIFALCKILYIGGLILFSQLYYEVGIIIFIIQVKKLRYIQTN